MSLISYNICNLRTDYISFITQTMLLQNITNNTAKVYYFSGYMYRSQSDGQEDSVHKMLANQLAKW